MGKATDLENIRWRAELLLDGEPDGVQELAKLILGLVKSIESMRNSVNSLEER